MQNKKLFLFGASFNPIHIGHIEIVNKISDIFNCEVELLPNINPKYKHNTINSIDKLEIIKLAIKKFNNLKINYTEINNYKYMSTYETLTLLNKTFQSQYIYFTIGLDSLITIDSWDNWQELFNLANFIIFNRNGWSLANITNQNLLNLINSKKYCDNNSSTKIIFIDYTPINISSTEIRTKIKNKEKFESYLDHEVYKYIINNKLYI